MSHYKGKTMKHEHGKSQQVKTNQRLWQAFIIASQTAKPCHPGKTALDDPAARQQNEAMLGLRQFDDVQAYPMCLGCLCWLITSVALIPDQPTRHGRLSLPGRRRPVRPPERDPAHWLA